MLKSEYRMQKTLQTPDQLDLVTFDEKQDEIVMIIAATGEWSGSGSEEAALLNKLNNYVGFALEGGLAKQFPDRKWKSVRIQIDCLETLPAKLAHVVTQAQALLGKKGISLCVNRIRR